MTEETQEAATGAAEAVSSGAAWHANPDGTPTWRWFDGTNWTEHTAPMQQAEREKPAAPSVWWSVLALPIGIAGSAVGLIIGLVANPPENLAKLETADIGTLGILLSYILGGAAVALYTFFIAAKIPAGGWRKTLKWGFDWKRDIPIAIAFTIIMRGVGILLEGAAGESGAGSDPLGSMAQGGPGEILALALLIGVAAPFVEEIFFRGLFLTSATKAWGKWIALIVTSAVFASLHINDGSIAYNAAYLASTFTAGIIFGLLLFKTQRIGTTIAAHSLFNLSAIPLILALG